jgi:predicted nucleic acid-binding protein
MNVVVDTNIIFSALLNTNGTIGDLLFNSDRIFIFYSCSYMRAEIRNHWAKLKKISSLSDEALQQSFDQLLPRLQFINEEVIPVEIWLQAEAVAHPIDIDDTDFVALTLFLDAWLWTGDKVLYSGLKRQSFNRVLTTSDLLDRRGSSV